MKKDLTHVGELLAGFDIPKPADADSQTVEKPLSKRSQKRVDRIERIRLQRESDDQQIGYLAKPFLLCGLPFKPKRDSTDYRRENGQEILEITASSKYGLPFGADIQVLVWVSTLAVLGMREGKIPRVIEFRRASDMLKALGLPLDGRTYRRMQQRFLRIFHSTFFYGEKSGQGRVQMFRVHFFDAIDLWFTRDLETAPLPGEEFRNNRVVLSETFARDLERHHPPIELEAVRLWADKPAQLYFYLWLVYRCYVAKGRAEIPLMGPGSVKEQCGAEGYLDPESGSRNFRKKIAKWLGGVKAAWPECPAELHTAPHGDLLIITGKATAIR